MSEMFETSVKLRADNIDDFPVRAPDVLRDAIESLT